jgi:hypothetical protein
VVGFLGLEKVSRGVRDSPARVRLMQTSSVLERRYSPQDGPLLATKQVAAKSLVEGSKRKHDRFPLSVQDTWWR